MKLPLKIAFRYLFAKKSHNVINIISAISAIGMAIGTAALILILSVYNGFDRVIRDNLSDLDPDILVSPARGKFFVPEGPAFEALLDDARIAAFLRGFQHALILEREELSLLSAGLVSAVLSEAEKLYRALAAEGVWPAVKGYMESAGCWEDFQLATTLDEDDPLIQDAVAALTASLGLTDEKVEALLAASVAE